MNILTSSTVDLLIPSLLSRWHSVLVCSFPGAGCLHSTTLKHLSKSPQRIQDSMAKRRRSRAGSAKPESSARSTGRGPKHTSPASQIPTERQIPRGVAAARAKHANDHNIEGSVVHTTLADRFYALPGELRNHIFALILVRPVSSSSAHAGMPYIQASFSGTSDAEPH